MVPDVRPFILLPWPYLFHLALLSFLPFLLLSPFLGSSRCSTFFNFSGLPLGQLNPLALRCSVTRVLGIPFPNISKLRDGAILIKTHLPPLSL